MATIGFISLGCAKNQVRKEFDAILKLAGWIK